MSATITKEQELHNAREMLKGWMQAEVAVMTGQDYSIGSRRLRRADLKDIAQRIKYWKAEVDRLEGRSRIRVQQVIPRDT